jgi:hypothetical protein
MGLLVAFVRARAVVRHSLSWLEPRQQLLVLWAVQVQAVLSKLRAEDDFLNLLNLITCSL